MATVTYYFNAHSSTTLANPANANDGNTTTWGYIQGGTASLTHNYSGNTSSGSFLGVITKVEMRIYSACTSTGSTCTLRIQPEFGGSDLGTQETIFDLFDTNYGPQWSSWYDITTDTNAPDWGTYWNNIDDLDLNCSGGTAPVLGSISIYSSEVRVTYVPMIPVAQVI